MVWAAADRDDPPDPEIGDAAQLYNLDAVAYESILLGLFEIHLGPNNELQEDGAAEDHGIELRLQPRRFSLASARPPAHIPAERRDVWDRGYVQSLGNICCVRGDKLWIYYTGFQGDANKLSGNWLQNGMYDRGATGVAFLRRDGFASMDAGAEPATLTTRPVTFSGRRVFVNAATADGELRVEILDEAGQPIAPFTLENCRRCAPTARWNRSPGPARRTCRPCAASPCDSASRCATDRCMRSGSAGTKPAAATATWPAAAPASPA